MNIYDFVNEILLSALARGEILWSKPWIADGQILSHISGRRYSFLNACLLGSPGEYLTYHAALIEGGYVRKGEKGRPAVFFKCIDEEDKDSGENTKRFILRRYTLFRVDQCENIKPRWKVELDQHAEPHEEAERVLRSYWEREHIRIRQMPCDECSYSPSWDEITLPMMEQFRSTAGLWGSAAHESMHSVGHPKRLHRFDIGIPLDQTSRAKEEIVAEIGAAYLVQKWKLQSDEDTRNHAAYLASWLKGALRNDRRLLVIGATQAEKAVNYILYGRAEAPQDMVEEGE